jgi:hypothetical protein
MQKVHISDYNNSEQGFMLINNTRVAELSRKVRQIACISIKQDKYRIKKAE